MEVCMQRRRYRVATLTAAAVILFATAGWVAASPAAAQGGSTGTPKPASIRIDPGAVAAGQTGVALTITALDGELFSQPAGKHPDIEFGPGVTVRSFVVDSGKRATAIVDTATTAFGVVEVRVKIYALNGTDVAVLATGNLGITGPYAASGVTFIVTDTPEVTIDVPTPQAVGAVDISGVISGLITVRTPLGVTFSTGTEPRASTATPGFQLTGAAVNDARDTFTVTLINATGAIEGTVRLDNMRVNLGSFTAAGGVEGEIALSVTIASPRLTESVAVARTPGKTYTNPDADLLAPIEDDDDDGATGGPGTGQTPTNNTSNTRSNSNSDGGRNDSSLDDDDDDEAVEEDRSAERNRRIAEARRRAAEARSSRNASNRRDNSNRRPSVIRGGNTSSRSSGGSGGGSRGRAGSLRATGTLVEDDDAGDADEIRSAPGRDADGNLVIYSFTLCDERFKPLPALGLKPADSGEPGEFVAQVWIELVFDEDPSPESRSSLSVDLNIPWGGTTRVRLRETAYNSGVFRCDAKGIALTFALIPGE
jgi:hypothetical protein